MKLNVIFLIILVLISVAGISIFSIFFDNEVKSNANEFRDIPLENQFDETAIENIESRDQQLWNNTNYTEQENHGWGL